jgi:hypothetical protein
VASVFSLRVKDAHTGCNDSIRVFLTDATPASSRKNAAVETWKNLASLPKKFRRTSGALPFLLATSISFHDQELME